MKKFCRMLCLLSALFVCFFATGCSNREELGNVSVITGFVLDFSPTEQAYFLLAEMADFSGYEKSSSLSTKWLKAKGKSVSEVFWNLHKNAAKPLYVSHAKITLLGKGVQQGSIRQVIDFLMNQPDINPDLLIAMTDTPLEQLEQTEEKAICKTMYESMEKDGIPRNAKLYQLFQTKENAFSLPKVSFSENGILNQR